MVCHRPLHHYSQLGLLPVSLSLLPDYGPSSPTLGAMLPVAECAVFGKMVFPVAGKDGSMGNLQTMQYYTYNNATQSRITITCKNTNIHMH